MWSKIWNWITGAAKALFSIVFTNVKSSLVNLLNNKEVQIAALDAIEAVKVMGLKDNDALSKAVEILRQQGIAEGMNCSETILKTLVQNAYCSLKLSEE